MAMLPLLLGFLFFVLLAQRCGTSLSQPCTLATPGKENSPTGKSTKDSPRLQETGTADNLLW